MQKKKEINTIPFTRYLFAGAIAGITEISIMYPLDVVKTRMQSISGGEVVRFRQAVVQIIQNGEIRNLYQGMVSPILLETPKRAIKFASKEMFQQIYRDQRWLWNRGIPSSNNRDQLIQVLSGGSAGITESLIVTPFELVKIQLQNPTGGGGITKFNRSFITCVRHICKTHGISGLFIGWEPTMWRHFVWNASYFGMIFRIGNLLEEYVPQVGENRILKNAIDGSVGGCLSCLFSLPFDVSKTRIQNQIHTAGGGDPVSIAATGQVKYRWAWKAIRVIVREEGFPALYKGITPVMCRMGISGGFLFTAFNLVSEFLSKRSNQ